MTMSEQLLQRLADSEILRVAGAGDAITAKIAQVVGFESIWAGGLAITASRGVPDASILSYSEHRETTVSIVESVSLPVIADCDAGYGDAVNVRRLARDYARAGVAGICLEDKLHPKRNSFSRGQHLADRYEFAAKISVAREAVSADELTVIGRVEALVAGMGLEEAWVRASTYVDAGADAILIHSKSKQPDEVLDFAERWEATHPGVPLVVVPTTFPQISSSALQKAGFGGVIYANQALRASIVAMSSAFSAILAEGASAQIESSIASVIDIFELVGMGEVEELDRWAAEFVERGRLLGLQEPSPAHKRAVSEVPTRKVNVG